jgi:hypothetical protein
MKEFSNALNNLFEYVIENLNRYPYPELNNEQQEKHNLASICKFCNNHLLVIILNVDIMIIIQENMLVLYAGDAI